MPAGQFLPGENTAIKPQTHTPHAAARVAASGLIATLVIMAGLAFWSTVAIQRAQDSARHAADSRTALIAATDALQRQSPERLAFGGVPSHIPGFSSSQFGRQMSSAAVASPSLQPDAATLAKAYDRYAHDARAARFDGPAGMVAALTPAFNRMTGRLAADARSQDASVTRNLSTVSDTASLFRVAAAADIVAIVLLVVLFVWATRRNRVALEHEVADRLSELERDSLTDTVTGLGNHRSFQTELYREVGRSQRHGHPVALALVDIDNLTALTDKHGHVEGDRLLARLASSMGGRRAEDRTFRLTGGEFGLILPYTTAREVSPLMENFRIEVERGDLGVTVSIGIANITSKDDSLEALRQRAEDALSEARRQGGNRVVFTRERTQPIPERPALAHTA